jgi:hypothetical protein
MNFYLLKIPFKFYLDSLEGHAPIQDFLDVNKKINFSFELKNLKAKASSRVKGKPFFIREVAFGAGYIFNPLVKKILEEYNLPEHEYFKLTINFRGDDLEFWWFRVLVTTDFGDLDLDKSVFIKDGVIIKNIPTAELMKANNPIDASIIYAGCEMSVLGCKKEILQYDIFTVSNRAFGKCYIISERLKLALEKNKIKGIEFEEIKIAT